MPWVYLLIAGICEIVWAIGLKYSDGFTKLIPSIWTVLTMLLSFVILSLAMRDLPLGTAYAVWTGIGATGTAIWGIWRLGEPASLPRLICLAMIIIGIVGLKLTMSDPSSPETAQPPSRGDRAD